MLCPIQGSIQKMLLPFRTINIKVEKMKIQQVRQIFEENISSFNQLGENKMI